jgi:LEA14-like dessication related protein
LAKGLKIGLLLLFIALLCSGVYFYFNPKKALNIIVPEISDLKRVRIKLIGDTAYINLVINASNKGVFKLHIDTLEYRIRLDTSTLLSKSEYLGLQLKKGQEDSILLPLALPFKRLMRKIKSLQGQDSVDVPVEVRVVYSTVFGKAVLPYSKTLRIEVPHPPKFSVEKIEYVKYHKKELLLNAHINIHNPGKIDLAISGLSYTMTVKDLFVAIGKDLKEIRVKPGTMTPVELPIKVKFKSLIKAIGLILENKDKVNYHLKVEGFIQNDKLGDEKTPVVIEKDGVMELKK